MKKIIALLLSLSFLFCFAPGTYALSCEHNYQVSVIPATCISREKTVYTCSLCGYTYEEEKTPQYTVPGELYLLLESTYIGDSLTVKAYLGNNPGIYMDIVKLSFNSEALQVLSVTNGDVWTSDKASSTINTEFSYIKHIGDNYDSIKGFLNNYNNGLLFTVEFKVTKPMQDWNINVTCDPKNFINADGVGNNVSIINTITLGYGEHSWDNGTVTLLPTVNSEGVMTYKCKLCNQTKTEAIPVLPKYRKGDINNDTYVDLFDLMLIRQYLVGMITYNSQEFDAADINNNQSVDLIDLFEIKCLILDVHNNF